MKIKLSGPIIAGHIIECFDNTLYGFFAVMLAPLFFPSSDPRTSALSSFVAFAAGFIARPLGAFIFGFIGDRNGRKTPLLYAMALVGIPTFLIGCVPTYESIGLAASVLIIILRLLQGIFYGAEFPGVNIYIYESFSKETLGKYTGILVSSGALGAVLAAVIGAFVTMQAMPSWAWRIPFLIGGLSAFYVTFLRRNIIETAGYYDAKRRNALGGQPWHEIFRNHKRSCVVAICICGLTVVPLYLTTAFGNQLFKTIGYTVSESMLFHIFTMVISGLSILYTGRLADRLGFQRQILIGCALLFVSAVPMFFLITYWPSSLTIFIFVTVLNLIASLINGCAMPYVSGLFPTSCRYTAVAATWTIGMALIGGNTPLIAFKLVDLYDTFVAAAFWLMAVSGGTWFLVFSLRPTLLMHQGTPKKI